MRVLGASLASPRTITVSALPLGSAPSCATSTPSSDAGLGGCCVFPVIEWPAVEVALVGAVDVAATFEAAAGLLGAAVDALEMHRSARAPRLRSECAELSAPF